MAERQPCMSLNYASFTNNGAGATWTAFDMPGTGYQTAVAMIDPTTGLPRLIFGNDTGIWSVLDDNGSFETTIGGIGCNRRHQPQRQPPACPVLLRCGAAQHRRGRNRRRLVLRRLPRTTGAIRRPRYLDHRRSQWSINADGQLQTDAGVALTNRVRAPSSTTCSLTRGVTTPTPISSRSTASVEPTACSRPPAAMPRPTRNGCPRAWPISPSTRSTIRTPSSVPHRPDLLHHQRGRDLVRHR